MAEARGAGDSAEPTDLFSSSELEESKVEAGPGRLFVSPVRYCSSPTGVSKCLAGVFEEFSRALFLRVVLHAR
jgi:hypothetical protein